MNDGALHETIHTVISESEGAYVAECLEVAVVTQGDSLDETLRNLREAVDRMRHDGEPLIRYGHGDVAGEFRRGARRSAPEAT